MKEITLRLKQVPRPAQMLVSDRPHLNAEYMLNRNPLPPEKVTAGSGKKVWWKCSKCGYEWQARVAARNLGNGCPACSNLIATETNCLATKCPELVCELHPTKNGIRTARDIVAGSGNKVWWECSTCSHEWQATPNDRKNGKGCPACAGKPIRSAKNPEQKIVANNLAMTHPHLVERWHPTLNGERTIQLVRATNAGKAWWHCSVCGHPWQAAIKSMANGKISSHCPNCRRMEKQKKRREISARRRLRTIRMRKKHGKPTGETMS